MSTVNLTHLQRLEAEAIHIMREVVAEAARPVMLYSVGKDSAVMLHLARKAFFPAPPPFPLLHVDTTWKFRAMYELRERAVQREFDRVLEQRGGKAKLDQRLVRLSNDGELLDVDDDSPFEDQIPAKRRRS